MTTPPTPGTPERFSQILRSAIEGRSAQLVVGLDGRSGAGKSTLASATAGLLVTSDGRSLATVIEGDQFYAGGSSATWDARTAQEKADRVIDWRRQRMVLADLLTKGTAEWQPFDWEAPDWDADEIPLSPNAVRSTAAPVVILEGAYSCRPELHDLLDLKVLLTVPIELRRRRLLEREGEAYRDDWEQRWAEAEDHHFGSVMPPERFDVVLHAT